MFWDRLLIEIIYVAEVLTKFIFYFELCLLRFFIDVCVIYILLKTELHFLWFMNWRLLSHLKFDPHFSHILLKRFLLAFIFIYRTWIIESPIFRNLFVKIILLILEILITFWFFYIRCRNLLYNRCSGNINISAFDLLNIQLPWYTVS